MTRTRLALVAVGVVFAAPLAMYFLNPFNTPSEDPRARIFGFLLFRAPSRNMEPTLHEGETFLVNVATLRNRDPAVGEIIVFQYPPRPEIQYVERVVAAGGSTIEMRKGVIWLDGKRLDEPWLPREPITRTSMEGHEVGLRPEDIYYDMPPTLVPKGHFFVLGDNRANSSDSRHWGLVPRAMIIGVYSRKM